MTPKQKFWILISIIICLSLLIGSGAGWLSSWYYLSKLDLNLKDSEFKTEETEIIKTVSEESAVIEAVKKTSPSVVSIIVIKEMPVLERRLPDGFFGFPQYEERGTEEREVGGGTGFLVSSNGYIVTNKHVVSDVEADYTVLINGQDEYQAEVVAQDSIMDVAILKIEGDDFSIVELGDSSNLQVGQTVIAIGNALGEFKNTVSTGVISGLSRSIVAGAFIGERERLTGLIQTDASINQGNSGGPLLDISGRVIGINTAMATGAENIGFAIPINEVKNSINDVKEHGRIIRPWLGIRYVQLNQEIAEKNSLEVDYGALIIRGQSLDDLAVIPGSPADKAGLEANDIVLEINGQKVTQDNPLGEIISGYKPGEKIELKILRKGEEIIMEAELEERGDN